MNKIFIFIIAASIITSCSNSNKPEALKPSALWNEIGDQLELQFGQHLSINGEIEAVVIDVTRDEGGIWYGLCFINDDKLFGRQIPNGILFPTCIDVLDLTYLNQSAIELVEHKSLINLSINSISVGSTWPATNLNDILTSYNFGIERRKLEQTPCTDDIFGLNPIRECYFDIGKFKK